MKLEDFVGKRVNIECTDGEKYNDYYVSDFWDSEENGDTLEVYEDSIGIQVNKKANEGYCLYEHDIKSIEIID